LRRWGRLQAIVLLLICAPVSALAQSDKWETVRYDQWKFAAQIPAGAAKHPIDPPESGTLDLYSSGGLACSISVTPTPNTQLASTVIEKAIQEEIRRAGGLGAARRWEQASKQGDLFKGYVAPAKLDETDVYAREIGEIIGGSTGVRCAAMAPLGDDTAPILWISVCGTAGTEKDVITTAKAIAASVKRDAAPPNANAASPEPKKAKPWPALKNGEIELEGGIESVAKDGRHLVIAVDFIRLYGHERIALSPVRTKEVRLKTRLDGIAPGVRVILIGRNTGIGKPMAADVIEAIKQ